MPVQLFVRQPHFDSDQFVLQQITETDGREDDEEELEVEENDQEERLDLLVEEDIGTGNNNRSSSSIEDGHDTELVEYLV